MIAARELTKRFGGRTAISAVSLDVAAGETVGFLGPNGAGKTTTLRILAGIFPPTAGSVRIGDADLGREPLRARASIGYLPERPALYGEMTVTALLRFVVALRGTRDGTTPERAAAAALERTRLGELANRRIHTLSKGMRQRVALAAAIVGDPPVLLLDEPTAGLDPTERTAARSLIRDLAPRRAVLLSSHLLEDVSTLCDRVIVLHRGRVIASDRPEKLATRLVARSPIDVVAHAPSVELATVLARVPGVRRVTAADDEGPAARCRVIAMPGHDVRPAVAAAVVEHGWPLLTLARAEPSLEEIFLDLVERGGEG
ncbi:MAG TPA: ABC transporter ATP-binding protein [Candidatus Limnocylindria bacterium]|nr:ABC transporter ATP-binding protein [Candidatus Limnocylindria bacterium]